MKLIKTIPLHFHTLQVVLGLTEDRRVRLLHFGASAYAGDENIHEGESAFISDGYPLVQLQLSGVNRPFEKQGNMYIATLPGCALRYVSHHIEDRPEGTCYSVVQEDEKTGIRVISRFQGYNDLSLIRITHTVENIGTEAQTLEAIPSFSYLGLERPGEGSSDDKLRVHVPFNGWQKELSWQAFSLPELGLGQTQPSVMRRTSHTAVFSNTGNWSTKDFLPMGIIENLAAKETLFFQIDHNGSWMWEIGLQSNHFYLNVSGPEEVHHHFTKTLRPGETFTTVPVCVGAIAGSVSEAISMLTAYRRRIRRPNRDNEQLPVIFNDYMNCLFGDPTTDKEVELIHAAEKAGCEYYVIDAGWYAPGSWWDGVGEWRESRERFPEGIRALTDRIRHHGMVPGLWLEIEVMGIHCPMVDKLPSDWFFQRHGKPVYDRSRLQLDFRNPQVRAYADSIIDRLVTEYGVGYIKMDYNIEPGIGTQIHADSPGEGLLSHERAYLDWLDKVFARYPDLVIENCSSGGMRMDYALLSRCSLQSTSDQEDYIHYSTIACNAPSGVCSEQAAVWSYPMRDADAETAVFNMVNAMMGSIHQSGHLAQLSEEALGQVESGIKVYRDMREHIPESLPYWPLGFAHSTDPYAVLLRRWEGEGCMAVWKREQEAGNIEIPLLGAYPEETVVLDILFPEDREMASKTPYVFDASTGVLTVSFPEGRMARIFKIRVGEKREDN